MKNMRLVCFVMASLILFSGVGEATEVTLNQVTFPERNQIEIGFARDQRGRHQLRPVGRDPRRHGGEPG
jgi:hypothetical protein